MCSCTSHVSLCAFLTALKSHVFTLPKIYPQRDRDGPSVTGSVGIVQPTSLEIDESSLCARCLSRLSGLRTTHCLLLCRQPSCPATMFAWSFIDGSPLERAEREAQKADEHLGDNDNDNDILREVPHPSNEGLALQGKSVGAMASQKESVLLV